MALNVSQAFDILSRREAAAEERETDPRGASERVTRRRREQLERQRTGRVAAYRAAAVAFVEATCAHLAGFGPHRLHTLAQVHDWRVAPGERTSFAQTWAEVAAREGPLMVQAAAALPDSAWLDPVWLNYVRAPVEAPPAGAAPLAIGDRAAGELRALLAAHGIPAAVGGLHPLLPHLWPDVTVAEEDVAWSEGALSGMTRRPVTHLHPVRQAWVTLAGLPWTLTTFDVAPDAQRAVWRPPPGSGPV